MYVWEFIYLPWIWGLRCVLVWYAYLWNWLKLRTANIISRSVSKLANIFPKTKNSGSQWVFRQKKYPNILSLLISPTCLFSHSIRAVKLLAEIKTLCLKTLYGTCFVLGSRAGCLLIWGSISSSFSPHVKVALEKVLHTKLSDACIWVFEWQIALKVRKCFECSVRVSKWYIYPVRL